MELGKERNEKNTERQMQDKELRGAIYMRPDFRLKTKDVCLSSDYCRVYPNCGGVTDGISQWKQFGIDPKYFSHDLLSRAVRNLRKKLNGDCQENLSL